LKASELKKGMIIIEGNNFLTVVDVDHKTPGNLRAIYQITLKNMITGRVNSVRYNPSDSVEEASLESKKGQYLFHDHAGFHFMDMETYDSIVLPDELIGDIKNYLKENLEIEILYHGHTPIIVETPVSINLKVTETTPGIKGDTVGKSMKSAVLETGMKINVPLFVNEGDVISVDTRDGKYLGRA